MNATTTLISTLGGQAQIVTFALDFLLARGEPIAEVLALHVAPHDVRIQRALAQLRAEFLHGRYGTRPCHFRNLPVRNGSTPLDQIGDEADAEATWQTVHGLLAQLKAEGHHLHLCVAGGPRLIALMAMSAATLLFDHHDRLWHMSTPPDFLARAKDGAILHAQPADGVRLIQVPLAPWGAYFPGLRSLAQASPTQVIAAQTQWLDRAEHALCETVVHALTGRRLDVLRAFAHGLNPQDVAENLGLSIKTVDGYKTEILSECRVAWSLPEDGYLSYHFLRQKFERYFVSEA